MSTFEKYYYKNIAERIRTLRISNGYTQEELSEKLSKNPKYINHIECCSRKISNKMLIKIMDFFQILPSDFFKFEVDYEWIK